MILDMADTVINLSQVVRAVQQDNNVLTDITNICKAINKVSINGLDVATVTSNVNIIKDLSNSIKPILQSLNGLQVELNKVDITNFSNLSTSLDNVKTISNSVLGLAGDFNSDSTELASKISSLTETGVQLASFAAAIYCPALKSGQVAKGLLAGLNSLGDGLKANNGMSLDNVMNKQGLNPLLMGSVKAANSVLTELVDLDLEEWGDEAMKTMVGDKVSLITEAGSLVKNYSTSLYKNEKSGLLVDLKSLNEVMNKTSELQNLKSGSFNAIYEPLNIVLESLIFDGDELLRQASGDDMKNVMNGLLGYTKLDEAGNEAKSEGLFPQLLVYSKAIEKLFQPGGTFSTLTSIDTSSIDMEKIAPTLHTVSEYLDVVIESTKEMGVNGEDPANNQKIAQISQAATHLENFKSVIENVNNSVSRLTDMLDPKNNPLMGGVVKMAFVKRSVKRTFRNLTSIIEIINDEIEDLSEELESLDLNKMKDDFEKISSTIKSITETVDNLIKLPLKLLLLTISTPLLVLGMAMFSISLITIATITNKISQVIGGLMDTTETFKKTNELIKLITETVDLLISLSVKLILAIPVVLLGVVSGIIVAGLMFVLVAEIKLMFKALSGLDSSNAATAKQTMIDIKELLDAVLHLSLKMILLSLIMIPAIIAGTIVIAGLWVMSFIIKGIALLSNTIQSLGAKQATEAIMDIKELLKAVIDISKTFILLALIMVPALIAGVIILPGLAIFALILNVIAFTFTKLLPSAILNEVVETIKNIQTLLRTVIKISWTFILLALIMVPAIIAGAIILPGLAIFALILNAIVVTFSLTLPGAILKSVNKTISNIKKLLNNIIKLSASIILLALIIVPTIIAGGIVLLGLTVFSLILNGIALILSNPANIVALKAAKNSIKEFNKVLRSLMALCLTIILLALVIIPATLASVIVLAGLAIISLVTFGIVFFIKLLYEAVDAIKISNILKIVLVFGVITLAMGVFMIMAMIMVSLQNYAEQIKVGVVLAFIGGMIAIAIAFAALGYACVAAQTILLPAMVGILALTGSMLVVLGAFLGMAVILNNIQNIEIDPEVIKNKSFDILNASKDICLSAVNIAKLVTVKEIKKAKKTIKNIRRLVKQVGEIAKILDKVNEIELDGNLIESNVKVIFLTANQVISSIGNEDGTGVSPKTIEKNSLRFKLTLNTFNVVFDDLNKLVKILNDIQKIKLDGEVITSSVKVVFQTAKQVVSSLGNEDGTGISPETIEKNGAQFKLTLVAFNIIFDDLNKLVKILDDVQKVKLDGKVITDSINVVFKTANEIIEKIVNNENVSLDKLRADKKEFDKISNQYKAIFEDFAKLTNILSGVDLEKFKNQTNGGFIGIITDIAAASKKLEEVDGEKINKTLNSYGDFLKKVDSTNLKKLETSAKMFEEMAKFSESINGNFDKMADTLNEKIGPLLEDLKNTLNDVHIQVTENGAQAQANSNRIVEKQEIREQMQASGQTRNLTVEEVDRRIDRKYQENVQQRYGIDEIASKLATLIDLFQSGEALVKTT